MKSLSVLIVGVGGQGTLLASRIIGGAFIGLGFDVKVSEVHGMSQRGGSVVTYVKCGERVDSPIICEGEADIILAFEQLEAARFLPFLRTGGTVVCNTHKISPMPVITGAMPYPDGLIEKIEQKEANVASVDAQSLAERAGSIKAVNVVLIGFMAGALSMDPAPLRDAIENCVPTKLLEINRRAFAEGYDAGRS